MRMAVGEGEHGGKSARPAGGFATVSAVSEMKFRSIGRAGRRIDHLAPA
jgi:hypothetical protein